jgi:hypothetical protein
MMDVYDAHVHFLWESSLEEEARQWEALADEGLRGMAVIVMGYHLGRPSKCLELIPKAYHHRIAESIFRGEPDPARALPGELPGLRLFPYLDSRFIQRGEEDLAPFRDAGYKGLKVLYVPEEDQENGMVGWQKLFGRTVRQSEDLTANLVEQAAEFGWPVIFHADLRRYGGFVEDLLRSFTGTPFVIPHFGFSRKAVAGVLERWNNAYTDFSSLLPFMKKDPDAYKSFIAEFPDRVLFGTDATMGWADLTRAYLGFVREMLRDEEVLQKILSLNYLRVHGLRDESGE